MTAAVYRGRETMANNQNIARPADVHYNHRRDVPVGVPLDLSVMEWHELPKYNGIQVSQLIYYNHCPSVVS